MHKPMLMRGNGGNGSEVGEWSFRKFVWVNKRGDREDLKNREESTGWRAYVE